MDPSVACIPKFSRGQGLGNRLFPWARCTVFSSQTGIPMLAPCWLRPAVRQLFRGGIARRYYMNQFMLAGIFDPPEHSISGLAKLKWWKATIAEEPADFQGTSWTEHPQERSLIVFRGHADLFARLGPFHPLILRSFRSMVKPKWCRLADSFPEAVIGINVRRGRDFHDATDPSDFLLKGGLRTPLDWFKKSLKIIREALGFAAVAVIVSDGSESDLAPLLSLNNVRLLRPGCAVSDLLVLARTRILIASGGSSFSAWASFLGQMPTITVPGQSLVWFKLAHANGNYVGEFDTSHPPCTFLNQVEAIAGHLARSADLPP